MHRLRAFLLLVALLALPSFALAQNPTQVVGTVTDTNGSVYSGATLEVVSGGVNFTPGAFVTNAGTFNVFIPPGTYTFRAKFGGIAPPVGTGPQVCFLANQAVSGTGQVVNLTGCTAILNASSGGSMTWPTGAAGIPNYNGSQGWGASYNALAPIPANLISALAYIGGLGTVGYEPIFVTNATTLGNSPCDHGVTTANVMTCGDTGGIAVAAVKSAGAVSSGTAPSAAGSTATGGMANTEAASTGWTPISGQDYIRADSTQHEFLESANGGAETPLVNAANFNAIAKTLTGCNTANFVYVPQGNNCVAQSGGGIGGTVIYTSAQTASTADQGKLVILNCGSACAYTLPATQPSTSFYASVVTLNSNGSIALGGSDTWYGVASAPPLTAYQPVDVYANSATSTDYRGRPILEGGGGATVNGTATGVSISPDVTSLQQVGYSATPTFEPAFGQYVIQFACTTAGAAVSPALSGINGGELVTLIIVQNGTTACTWTWPSNMHGVGTVSSTLSSINVQQFVVSHNGTDAYAVTAMQTSTGGTP